MATDDWSEYPVNDVYLRIGSLWRIAMASFFMIAGLQPESCPFRTNHHGWLLLFYLR